MNHSNVNQSKRPGFQFRFQFLVGVVGIAACLAFFTGEIRANLNRAKWTQVHLELQMLSLALELKNEKLPTASISTNSLNSREELVFQLGGDSDGRIHYEFHPQRLMDSDNDGSQEYRTIFPSIFYSIENDVLVLWDSSNERAYDEQSIDLLAGKPSFHANFPFVILAGLYCFSFMLLPDKIRRVRNFLLGLVIGLPAVMVAFCLFG